uniref:Uncharacterized protein n=1 Tax=Zea mays TaxID=4577 RepID=B4FQ94_MAIZE|nr:unknown [Zea mays]
MTCRTRTPSPWRCTPRCGTAATGPRARARSRSTGPARPSSSPTETTPPTPAPSTAGTAAAARRAPPVPTSGWTGSPTTPTVSPWLGRAGTACSTTTAMTGGASRRGSPESAPATDPPSALQSRVSKSRRPHRILLPQI